MTIHSILRRGDFVVCDTDFCIVLTKKGHHYSSQCVSIFNELAQKGVGFILPQMVECELLKNAKDIVAYIQAQNLISDCFTRVEVDSEMLRSACILNALLYWNESTKDQMQKKNIFNDLVNGALAAHYERENKCRTYILSSDHDYMSPYFKEEASFTLLDKNSRSTRTVFLYSVDRITINTEWKSYLKIHKECAIEQHHLLTVLKTATTKVAPLPKMKV